MGMVIFSFHHPTIYYISTIASCAGFGRISSSMDIFMSDSDVVSVIPLLSFLKVGGISISATKRGD